MRKFAKLTSLAAMVGMLAVAAPSHAALQSFSPVTPVTVNGNPIPGLPAWIQDINGVSVGLCFDLVNCGLAGMPGFNAGVPLAFTPGVAGHNFPDVPFYFDAVTDNVNVGAASIFYIAFIEVNWVLNGALTSSATPGAIAVPFQRQRLRTSYAVPGIYTVDTPWGGPAVMDGTACTAGTVCTITNDFPVPAGVAPGGQAAANTIMLGAGFAGSMSTFLKASPAPAVPGFLGLAAPAGAFTGAVAPNLNQFTIHDPGGATGTVSTLALLTGQIFGMEVTPNVNNFGPLLVTIPTATPSAPVTITVTNPDALNPMTIAAAPGGLVLGGANITDFTITADTCSGAALTAAGGATPSCTFTATFAPLPLTPTEVANRTATVTITGSSTPPAPAVPIPLPPGLLTLSGTAQYPVAATADVNGAITDAAGAALLPNQNAGAAVTYKVTPNPMFQVKDILVNGAAQDITAARPANPTQPVNFVAPAITAPQTINATFMPSANLTASGTLGVADALKALKIAAGLVTPTPTEQIAMDVAPLEATATGVRPHGDGSQDLRDVLTILRRVLGVVTW